MSAPRLNILDRAIGFFSPVAALRRQQARHALAYYEGAKPSKYRRARLGNQSPDALVNQGAAALRAHARYLERNHDLARGALRVLVNNVVGAAGIGVEPQPRRADGSIDFEYAQALSRAWREWCRKPEVTHRLRWPLVQRLMAYTWLRDGEVFAQVLRGPVAGLQHGATVPLSLELLEPDFVPLDYDDAARGIRQGIQRNAWGQPTAFWVYKTDPRDAWGASASSYRDLKVIPAANMLHLATLDRIHQMRGVSEFSSVLTRLEDLKDYEESERVAAKIAACLTAYVKRTEPAGFTAAGPARALDEQGNPLPRELRMEPGVIIDTLQVGEDIGLIDSGRPNANLVGWRAGQLRALAAGIGASYSSISRDYNGTYSAQRQELVEQWIHYAVLADEFAGMFVQPVWEAFVACADLSGVVRRPRDVAPVDADDALFIAQSMPWIDPVKEASAWQQLVSAGFASAPEVIRKRGQNPRDVLAQAAEWQRECADAGLHFTTTTAPEQDAGDAVREALQDTTTERESA